MAHVGIAVDHPANAQVIARMSSPRVVDRAALMRAIEARLERSYSAVLADSLKRLRAHDPAAPEPQRLPSQAPGTVDIMSLGTHPDIVDMLWKIGHSLPTDCAWVAYRQPVLAHSQTGVIFGLGVGTLGYGLRLPPDLSAKAKSDGAKFSRQLRGLDGERTFSLHDYGDDWWFGRYAPEDDAWARAAYDYFGAM
jgi:hypothetical protein